LSLAGVTGLLDAEWKPKHGMTVWPRGTDGFVQTTAKELAL
jgi:hypothetical protein